MNFLILGSGAMGCLYGAHLFRCGQQVTLLDVNEAHLNAIRENGLLVTSNGDTEALPIPACRAEDYSGTADLILLFTKAPFSQSALNSVRHAIGPDTFLMTLQNGLGHERLLSRYAAADHILIGTTNFPSDLTGLGTISVHGSGITRFQCAAGVRTERLSEIASVFQAAGLNPEITDDVFSAIWEKVSFNCAMNTLTAITLLPQGYVGQTEDGRILAHQIVDEVLDVADAKGISNNRCSIHQTVDALFTDHFMHCPSMLQDVINKRLTEVDWLNGAVAAEAAALGLKVPVTETVGRLVRILQQTYPFRKTIS